MIISVDYFDYSNFSINIISENVLDHSIRNVLYTDGFVEQYYGSDMYRMTIDTEYTEKLYNKGKFENIISPIGIILESKEYHIIKNQIREQKLERILK